MDRRNFVKNSAAFAAFGAFVYPALALDALDLENEAALAENVFDGSTIEGNFADPAHEKSWAKIIKLFPRPRNYTQLENGYFSHSFLDVRQLHQKRENYIQNFGSVYMRTEQEKALEETRTALAAFFGWNRETLAITRNTTESLNTVISGFPWKSGDEVIIGNQDYGSMNEAFEQAAKRFGIVIHVAQIPLLPQNDQQILDAYTGLITPKTRMVHLTHLINLSGQVIPLEKIIAGIRIKNEEICTVVDAAHSVAHIDYDWKNTGADAVAGSLHKWMCAPLGLGFLHIKPKWIPLLWPLMGDTSQKNDNIRRFEHLGTRPVQTHEALLLAIEMHQVFGGIKNKEKRLRYLQQSWTKGLYAEERIIVNTPLEEARSCAITNIAIKGIEANKLASMLWEKHHIFTVAINHKAINGIRVTPHLSNNTDDTTKLVNALKEIMATH